MTPEDFISDLDLNELAQIVHTVHRKWWCSLKTGKPIKRNKGELLMLMVSELSEAMEGERKQLQDDHLPHRPMAEVELADCLIRILDYCGAYNYDISGAFIDKLRYNATRSDHTHAARRKPGGKKF